MNLKLNKPLVFIDIEATGLNISSDRIIEIALWKWMPDGTESGLTERVNPGIPISEQAFKVHGISESDIKDCPGFKMKAPKWIEFIGNADLAGFNSNKYDIPLFVEECLRHNIAFDIKGRQCIDVQNIFHFMEPRNLKAAYAFYCQRELTNAHEAMADVKATADVFKSQLNRYKGQQSPSASVKSGHTFPNSIPELASFSKSDRWLDLAGRIWINDDQIPVFAFGKHKDKPVVEVFQKEPSYYHWIMQGDFALQTKQVVTEIRLTMRQNS